MATHTNAHTLTHAPMFCFYPLAIAQINTSGIQCFIITFFYYLLPTVIEASTHKSLFQSVCLCVRSQKGTLLCVFLICVYVCM